MEFQEKNDGLAGIRRMIADGLSVVNEEGPELIESPDGTFRMAKGSPALTFVGEDDRVYTAAQTREMLQGGVVPIPAYAKGKTPYQLAMEEYQHLKKTSDMSLEEQLSRLTSMLGRFGYDPVGASKLEEAIFAVNKSIEKRNAAAEKQAALDAEKARKERVSQTVSAVLDADEADRRWNEQQLAYGNITENDAIYAIGQRAGQMREAAQAVLANTDMNEEEKAKYFKEFTQIAEDYEVEYFTKNNKRLAEMAKEANRESLDYIADRVLLGDWESMGDDPIGAFTRVRERNEQALRDGLMTAEEYEEEMEKIGDALYQGRVEQSERWLEEQQYYGAISEAEYIQGLQRMQAYTQEYYDNGIIEYEDYMEAMGDLDQRIYAQRVAQYRSYVSSLEEEKRALEQSTQDRLSALEASYREQRVQEDEAARKQEIQDLKEQERLYENAQTKAGKARLERIREQLDRLYEQQEQADWEQELAAEREKILQEKDAKIAELEQKITDGAAIFGLAVDEDGNISRGKQYEEALAAQDSYIEDSKRGLAGLNQSVNAAMDTAVSSVTSGLLLQFGAFRDGLSAIVSEIAGSMAALGMLDPSAAAGTQQASTTVYVNDYGTKNINAPDTGFDYWNPTRLAAWGVKI